jgi:hypothetical protein
MMGTVINALVAAINIHTAEKTSQPSQDAVIKAYDRLKSALEKKCGAKSDLVKSLEMLEQRPTSGARVSVLEEEIIASQVEQSLDIVALAEALLKELDGQAAGKSASPTVQGSPEGQAKQVNVSPTATTRLVASFPTPLQRPPRAEHFVDRQNELDRLLNNLQPGRAVALLGPEGVGKTALAAAAVWQLAPAYALPAEFPDGLIYYNFNSRPQVPLLWEYIARMFDEELWPTPEEAAQRVLTNRRMLLVLDGVEKAKPLQDILALQGKCGVLMISCQPIAGVAEQQRLDPLPPEESVDLLRKWNKGQPLKQPVAMKICELLGGLPLAIRLAGCYMEARRETAEIYLDWLSRTPLAKGSQAQRVERGVAVVLERTLTCLDHSAHNLLAILGLLAMTPVEQGVLAEALNTRTQRKLWTTIQRVFKQEPVESAPSVRHPLQELTNYGLVWWRGQHCGISHPLIYNYIQQHLKTPAEAAKQLVAYYTLLAGEQILLGMGGYTRLNAERPHMMELLAGCVRRGDWKAAHDLAIAIEDYLDLQGHVTERVIANQIGLDAARKLGRGYNEVAWLGNLGLAYKAVGQVDQAIHYYEQALASAREVGDQRSEGNWLGNLGLAYRDLDEIDLARQYLNQSLNIFELINSPSADVIRDWLTELEDA